MEAEVAAIFSGLGTIISLAMVIDSVTDLRIVKESERPELIPLARHGVVNEVARLVIQFLFLMAAIVYAVDRFEFVRDIALLLLVTVPILLAAWSVYAYFRRRAWLRGKTPPPHRRHDDP